VSAPTLPPTLALLLPEPLTCLHCYPLFLFLEPGIACLTAAIPRPLTPSQANTAAPHEAALQVGKLSNNMFNVDMRGVVSPYQAFCSALAVFDQSSVRRRF